MSFDIAAYWESRYMEGGSSGAGSRGAEAEEKAAIVQAIVDEHHVESVLDLGCGDGFVASKLHAAKYVGYDVSPKAVALCQHRMRYHAFVTELPAETFDLVLSLDVIFHQVDDESYAAHLAALFTRSHRFVLIYGTDHDQQGAAHVRHRRWTPDVPTGWTLKARIPSIQDLRKYAFLFERTP